MSTATWGYSRPAASSSRKMTIPAGVGTPGSSARSPPANIVSGPTRCPGPSPAVIRSSSRSADASGVDALGYPHNAVPGDRWPRRSCRHDGRAGARPPWGVRSAIAPCESLAAVATSAGLVTVVLVSALRAPLLHGGNVRFELLLLVGVQDGSQRRDLLITLALHLPADLLHLRARTGSVAALACFTRFLH